MSESKNLANVRTYRVNYTAYVGRHGEFEIQGKNCRLLSSYDLAGTEIAEEIAEYIESDGLPVSHIVIHRVA